MVAHSNGEVRVTLFRRIMDFSKQLVSVVNEVKVLSNEVKPHTLWSNVVNISVGLAYRYVFIPHTREESNGKLPNFKIYLVASVMLSQTVFGHQIV